MTARTTVIEFCNETPSPLGPERDSWGRATLRVDLAFELGNHADKRERRLGDRV